MTKFITAEYLADEKVLRLDGELEGVADRARVRVLIESGDSPNWVRLIGSLSPEAADAWKKALDRNQSEDPFRRVWDNPEDAVYDEL
jgi:hypothetical protein